MSRIALVGPMGVGKTTVGRALGHRLHTLFIDLDERVEQTAGQTIPAIFSTRGEAAFRQSEFASLREVTDSPHLDPVVIATGGGIVETPECRALLKSRFTVVHLFASIETLLMHIQADGTERPLLRSEEPLEDRIRRLVARRNSLYLEVADFHVQVDQHSPDAVVDEIVNRCINANGG